MSSTASGTTVSHHNDNTICRTCCCAISKYQMVSGPEGMTVAEGGKVEWRVPKECPDGVREVRVQLRDAAGREATHSFQVRVE